MLVGIIGLASCARAPGDERQLLAFYAGQSAPWYQAALPDSCILQGIHINTISTRALITCGHTNYQVTAALHPFRPRGYCITTTNYNVCVTPDLPVLASTFAAVLANSPHITQIEAPHAAHLRLLALWAGIMAVLMSLLILYAGMEILRLPTKELVIFLALVVIALALRLASGLWAPIHANGHGIAEAEGMLQGVPMHLEGFAKGPFAYLVYSRLLDLLPQSYNALFVLNLVLSALACGFIFLSARNVMSRLPALGVALVPAVFPGLVTLAATEAPQNLVMFVASLGIFWGTRASRSRDSTDRIAAFGAFIVGSSLFFESMVLLIPAFVVLWGDKRRTPFGPRVLLGTVGIILLLPQAGFLLFSPGVTEVLGRLGGAMHAPAGLWQSTPVAFWIVCILLVASVFFVRKNRMTLLLPAMLLSAVLLGFLSLGASGWSTDPIRYQSEAIFLAIPALFLPAARLKGILCTILSGVLTWSLFTTPPPMTIEQQEFRFLENVHLPADDLIIPPVYHPWRNQGAVCAFPSSLFTGRNIVSQMPVPAVACAVCYYGTCSAARGRPAPAGRWQVYTTVRPGRYRYGIVYPVKARIGFYKCP